MTTTSTPKHPAIPQFDGDTRTTREEQVIDSIVGEVMAQLDEFSDDTWALLPEGEDDPLYEMADDLRLTLVVTIRQRLSDWVCDNETAAEALYDSDWHKAITEGS